MSGRAPPLEPTKPTRGFGSPLVSVRVIVILAESLHGPYDSGWNSIRYQLAVILSSEVLRKKSY